jgi:hypothetical protein
LQKFLSVGRGGFGVFESGEHPGDLAATLVTFDYPHSGRRHLSRRGLLHNHVPISKRGDLWKVRNDKNLGGACQSRQTTPHFNSGPATDTGIDFVKHQRACRLRTGDGNLQGKHDAREFTT